MSIEFKGVSIAAVRDFWNNRPCNIRHSPKPVGSLEYFNEVEARKYFVEPHIPRFADFSRWSGKRVLEIGCGIGTDTINFARAGARVTAVDLSEKSLELAQKRAQVFDLNDIIFVQANVEQLTNRVAVRDFDLVYSFGVIHHTPKPETALTEMVACLRPGGTLKLMVYYRFSWKAFAIVTIHGRCAFWDIDRIVARYSEAQEGCPVTYTYSLNQLRKIVEGSGCRVENMFVEHIFPWRIPDYVQYRYKKVWYFAALPVSIFHWLEQRIGWHLCVTAIKK